jgi:hypothetical protein
MAGNTIGASIVVTPPLEEIANLDHKILYEAIPFAMKTAVQYVRRRVVFFTPYRTGTLQSGWTQVVQEGTGASALLSFENLTPYGPILEFGLYPPEWIHPGGLLMQGSQGGVYTRKKYKTPGGMITPAQTH